MNPLTAPFKHLHLLQAERPYAQLAQEIMNSFKTIGLKVQVGE